MHLTTALVALALALAFAPQPSSSSSAPRRVKIAKACTPRFASFAAAAAAAAAATFAPLPPPAAYAAEELTSRQQVIRETENFLFNSKLLEAVRKMDQLEADEAVALQVGQPSLLNAEVQARTIA